MRTVPPPEIAAIRERAEKANAADWSVAAVIAVTVPAIREFITHAREDVPWLLSALERVTAEREAREVEWAEGRADDVHALAAAEAERDRLREALEATKGALEEWLDIGYVSAGGVGGDLSVRTASALNFADAVLAALAGGTDANAIHAQAGSAKVETGHNLDAAPPEQKP